jgi:hypothetical protein
MSCERLEAGTVEFEMKTDTTPYIREAGATLNDVETQY